MVESPAEMAEIQSKREENMTEKDKIIAERKRKRREREALDPRNYHRFESRAMFNDRFTRKSR